MAKGLPKSKPDYSLSIRYKKECGEWSEWTMHGKGLFENIEIVRKQIRLISAPYQGKEKEIRFEWNGWLCDYSGHPTGEVISLK